MRVVARSLGDEMEIKFLEVEFQRMAIGKNDTIVISAPALLTGEQMHHLEEQAKSTFPEQKIIILDGGLKIGVAAPV